MIKNKRVATAYSSRSYFLVVVIESGLIFSMKSIIFIALSLTLLCVLGVDANFNFSVEVHLGEFDDHGVDQEGEVILKVYMFPFLRHIKITPSLGNHSLFHNKIVTSRIELTHKRYALKSLMWRKYANEEDAVPVIFDHIVIKPESNAIGIPVRNYCVEKNPLPPKVELPAKPCKP